MVNQIEIEGIKYHGNDFFKAVAKRKMWHYEFFGNISSLLNSPDNILDGLSEKGQLVFNGVNIKLKEIAVLNFKGRSVRFNSIKLTDNELKISNCKIYFSNCTFLEELIITKCETSRIDLINCKGISRIYINDCISTYFNIVNLKFYLLNLAKCSESIIRVANSDKLEISMENCNFKEFVLENLNIDKFDYFETYINRISFSKLTCEKEFRLNTESKVNNYIFKFKYLIVYECKFYKLILNNEYFDLDQCPVEILISDTNNINIISHHLQNLTLKGEVMENIKIFSCKIDSVEFNEFSCGKNIKFQKSSIYIGENKLIITDSVLKGVEINPSFLHDFDSIDFKDSTISGIEIHNYKPVYPEVIRNSIMDIECKIDLCRELNSLMLSQNNRHYSTVYRALELELRAKSNDSSISWFDKQVLNLNFWSNVHGTMPQRALFWILLMIVVQFGVINLDLAVQTGFPYEAGFDFLSQNYSYFAKPFTFLSDVEESYKPFYSKNMQVRFHPVTKGFDFLFKIFYAYLLYQFIAAFRKFNK